MLSTSTHAGIAVEYLARRREAISARLGALCRVRGEALEAVLPGGAELMGRILEFAGRGKMLRGALVHLGAELFGGREAPGTAEAAAAMEFFQAGLLVHDDIMDRDETRRGLPSMHSRYAAEAAEAGARDAAHLGESLGICAGDVCLFEGFAALGEALSGAGPAAGPLLSLCASELSVVGLSQMDDCRFGGLPEEPSEEAILAMCRGKTARYSFSLPLALGAALAGRPELRPAIFEIGDRAGLAFQLRDDEIGLFGDPELTGKSAISDIRENKKTVWRARLLARADEGQRRRLHAIYGSPRAEEAEAGYLRGLIRALGVDVEIREWREGLVAEAKSGIAALPGAAPESARVLSDLVDWLVARKA